jgi:hypothetical protein
MLPGFGLLVVGLTIANVMWWRGRYSKAGVVRKYAVILARNLQLRCGPGPRYRATDVTRSLLASHVSTKFSSYAYAMFCDRAEFAKAPECSQLDYEAMQIELQALGVKAP